MPQLMIFRKGYVEDVDEAFPLITLGPPNASNKSIVVFVKKQEACLHGVPRGDVAGTWEQMEDLHLGGGYRLPGRRADVQLMSALSEQSISTLSFMRS